MKSDQILKILIPQRKETGTKWWHRLINVFIYGSTIFVAIFLFILLFTGSSWKKINYVYSFEYIYSAISGEESACKFVRSGFFSPTINCSNITNSTDFINKYAEAKRNGNMLNRLGEYATASDNQLIDKLIDSGQLDNIRVKESSEIIYSKLFGKIGLVILLVFVWFIFWESIVYRVILYVVYGKNR